MYFKLDFKVREDVCTPFIENLTTLLKKSQKVSSGSDVFMRRRIFEVSEGFKI